MFIELGRAEHIFPLLISGDEESSFPPSLKKIPDIRERIMDVRVPGGTAKEILKKAPDQFLKAVADITGCDEARLRRENMFRKNRFSVVLESLFNIMFRSLVRLEIRYSNIISLKAATRV